MQIFLEESTIKAIKISKIEKDVLLTFLTIFSFNSYSTKDSYPSIVSILLFLEPKYRAPILISSLGRIMAISTPLSPPHLSLTDGFNEKTRNHILLQQTKIRNVKYF